MLLQDHFKFLDKPGSYSIKHTRATHFKVNIVKNTMVGYPTQILSTLSICTETFIIILQITYSNTVRGSLQKFISMSGKLLQFSNMTSKLCSRMELQPYKLADFTFNLWTVDDEMHIMKYTCYKIQTSGKSL